MTSPCIKYVEYWRGWRIKMVLGDFILKFGTMIKKALSLMRDKRERRRKMEDERNKHDTHLKWDGNEKGKE